MAIERRLTGEPVELDPLLGSSLSGRYLLRELIERQGALRWYHAEIEQEERAVLATYVDLADVAGGDAGVDLVALRSAIDRLHAEAPDKATLVKLRYFTGLTIPQAADVLGVSLATAERWWAYSRLRLFQWI